MIYRINLEVGYRSVVLDFNTKECETKSKLSFQVINPEVEDEENE